jgi:hypothetical protein
MNGSGASGGSMTRLSPNDRVLAAEANDGAKVAQDVGIQASGILFVRVQTSVLSRSVGFQIFRGSIAHPAEGAVLWRATSMKRAMPNVRTPNGKPLKQAAEEIMKGEVTSLTKRKEN